MTAQRSEPGEGPAGMRVKLDRTVCEGFGQCTARAPHVFPLDEWGYPTLVGDGEIAPEDRPGVRRALLDCPAHAIVDLDDRVPLAAGGDPALQRNAGPDAPWKRGLSRPEDTPF